MYPELLKLLCCPETRQRLQVADPELIQELNRKVAAGVLRDRAGKPISEKIDAGFIRADGKFLYPVRDEIPIMLLDESVPL